MIDTAGYSLPSYNHDLLEKGNARFLSRVYAQIMKVVHAQKSQMAVDEVLCKELIAFNHPYVWHCALSVMLGPKNEQLLQELSTHIATANERHVKEFAYLGTAGILAGYDQLLTVIRKYPTTPLREATLTALEKYPLQIAEDTEIPLRITAVLGTAEHENIGTFGTALSSYVDEILVGQAIFLDMLRVYGSYFVKNNSISNGGFRFHPA